MTPDQIPIITVSYNSPDLIETLLASVRKFYANKVYVIDGSAPDIVGDIAAVVEKYTHVEFIPFGYNIHHGPGMAWAIQNLPLTGPVLFLDSDVEWIHPGAIEAMVEQLRAGMYGVGWITHPQLGGVPESVGTVAYLSPLCMLCNIDVMRAWPMPIKHGAPMINPMVALAAAGRSDLLGHIGWIENDCTAGSTKRYLRHDWQGTVRRTSGYHYDTQAPESDYNHELLPLIPLTAHSLLEVGCGNGSLARAYKQLNPLCHYSGVEQDPAAVVRARSPCDFVYNINVELADASFFQHAASIHCWVLSDVLHHLQDPAAILAKIRAVIAPDASLVASLPNLQHWSVQARLNQGLLGFESSLPTAHPHRGGFTRLSMLELFNAAGFQVVEGVAKMGPDPGTRFVPAIRLMAECAGTNPDLAVQDAGPQQYIVRAVPIPR